MAHLIDKIDPRKTEKDAKYDRIWTITMEDPFEIDLE